MNSKMIHFKCIYPQPPNKDNMGRELMKARASSSSSRCWCSLLLLILLLSSIFSTTNGTKANSDQEQQHMKPSWLKSVMSLTDTVFPYTSMYLEKGRVAIRKMHGYFFPPMLDIDFRSSAKEGGGGEAMASGDDVIAASKVEKGGGNGIGERMNEAASKSMEKSKSALEESAKLAGCALHELTDKLKKSFAKHKDPPHLQPEL